MNISAAFPRTFKKPNTDFSYAIYFCCVALKDYLLLRAVDAGATFFGTIEDTAVAIDRVLAGAAHPTS